MSKLHLKTIFILSACCAFSSSFAQDTLLLKDTVVVSANRIAQDKHTTARNVIVITKEKIQQTAAQSLGQLLQEQQGIYVVGSGQTPGSLQSLFMRSGQSNQYSVLIDGVRITDSSTPSGSLDLSEVNLSNIDRIEIIKGGHSAYYGGDNVGGLIHIFTNNNARSGFSGSASAEAGKFGKNTSDFSHDLTLRYQSKSGIYLQPHYFSRQTEGISAALDTTNSGFDRDNLDYEKWAINAGIQREKWNLDLSYENKDQNIDLDQGAYNDDNNANTQFDRERFNYNLSLEIGESSELNFNGGWSTFGRKFINDSSLIAPGEYDQVYFESDDAGKTVQNEITITGKDKFSEWVIGGGQFRESMSNKSYYFSDGFFGPFEINYNNEPEGISANTWYVFSGWKLYGAGLSESLSKLTFDMSARYTKHEQFGDLWNFGLNPGYKVSSSSFIYASISSGYKAPSLYQLYEPTLGSLTNRGNENLNPEESQSVELGYKYNRNNTSFSINYFNRKVDNSIEYIYIWDGATALSDLGFASYLGDTYINLSEKRTTGFELAFNKTFGTKFTVSADAYFASPNFKFNAADLDQNYLDGNHAQIYEGGIFVNGNNEQDIQVRRPTTLYGITAQYQLSPKVSINLSGRYYGERPDVFYDFNLGPFGALNNVEVDPYFLTNFKVHAQVNEIFSLRFAINNLFDEDYQEILGYSTMGRAFYLKAGFQF